MNDTPTADSPNSEHAGSSSSARSTPSVPQLDHPPLLRTSHSEPLGKGRACLQCRARKKRCDGLKPACATCASEKKECTYAVTAYSRARTRDLLGTVDALEKRLEELQLRAEQSSTKTPRPKEGASKHLFSLGEPSKFIPTRDEWWLTDGDPPADLRNELLETCLSNRTRPMLFIHVPRFRASLLSSPSPSTPSTPNPPPHQGLIWAMYAMGAFLTPSRPYIHLEPYLLARARKHQSDSLGDPQTSAVRWLQASNLLTNYLAFGGRFLESTQEISGALPLLLRCGLHKTRSSFYQLQGPQPDPPLLPPPKDDVEVWERVWVFWTAQTNELIISSVSGFAPNRELVADATCVWPRDLEEYETQTYAAPDAPASSLFGPNPAPPFDPPCSLWALHCKGLLILGRVSLFAIACTSEYIRTAEFRKQFLEYHHVVTHFLDGLPPIHHDPSSPTPTADPTCPSVKINPLVFNAHCIALCTHVQLYNAAQLASDVFSLVNEKRVEMASRMALLVRAFLLSGQSVWELSITCWCCWFPAGRVVAQHLKKLQLVDPDSAETKAAEQDLAALLEALNFVRNPFPGFGYQADRLEAFMKGEPDEDLSTHISLTHMGG